jgi:hypothetical protein
VNLKATSSTGRLVRVWVGRGLLLVPWSWLGEADALGAAAGDAFDEAACLRGGGTMSGMDPELTPADPGRSNVEYGDASVALPNEILRSVVGSGVHGIAIAGTDDHDEMGVYIEPPEYVVGLITGRDDYVWRTQPEGARSGPGDTDLILYSLRKYLRLAIKGNPTALLPLYAPEADLVLSTPLGAELRDRRQWFLSQDAVERFLGYMHSQHERMMGAGKRNRVPNRPELVAAHGWDVKYGSHALRLAHQGYEIAAHGTLTLPLAPEVRARVLSVKRGEVARDEVSEEIGRLSASVRALLDERRTAVPEHAELQAISAWAVAAQRQHWGW